MQDNIHGILTNKGFRRSGEVYYLFTENGSFVIGKEFRINERYTARKYTKTTFNTNNISVGTFYTAHTESFSSAISRSVKEFYRICKNEKQNIHSSNFSDLYEVI